jgi:hypothetical protein
MLWGNIDAANGYNKPVFANTTNVQSNSTIHGTAANTVTYYGPVFGVSAQETSNSGSDRVTHAGWVSQKIGTGPVASIGFSGGTGYNSGGYFVLTDGSVLASGTGANISYSIANSQNIMEAFSTNAQLNVINTITVVSGGRGYSSVSDITYYTTSRGITNATFTIVLGGRAGRKNYETIVAMGSITGDDPRDNVFFKNV